MYLFTAFAGWPPTVHCETFDVSTSVALTVVLLK
jgi:hypothetical protein